MEENYKAIDCYEKAIQKNSNYTDAHCNLGVSLAELGENESAIDSYNTAIKINPNYADAYYNLAIIFDKNGKLQKAKSCYEKALSINPSDNKTIVGFGNLLLKLNNHKKGLMLIAEVQGVIKFTQSGLKIIWLWKELN